MMTQDITKFTLFVVLLGIVLAIAIFRPQILPVEASPALDKGAGGGVESSQPSPTPQGELDRRQAALDRREVELDQRQAALDVREADLTRRQAELEGHGAQLGERQVALGDLEVALNHRQAELDGQETSLVRRQAELDQREAILNQRQAELDGRKAELDQRQAGLDERKAALEQQAASQEVVEVRLREWQADLDDREQEIQGFLRWSVVAASVSGLLAIPSVVVLVALVRKDRLMSEKGIPLAQNSRKSHKTRVGAPGELATAWPAPAYGDNGRGKASVYQRVRE